MKQYAVLKFSKKDLYAVAEGRRNEKQLNALIRKISDKEMQGFAERIGEAIFDGDQWSDAMAEVLDDVLEIAVKKVWDKYDKVKE